MKTLALVLCLFASVAQAVPLKGSVEFDAVSTSGLVKIHGTGGTVTGDSDGELTVELAPLDTDNDLRNKHMREKYLEVAKYPKATLKLDKVTPGAEFEWTGTLTLKNESKAVRGKAKLAASDLWAQFKISLADFPAIGVPSWLGVTVAKEVTVTVKAKTQ